MQVQCRLALKPHTHARSVTGARAPQRRTHKCCVRSNTAKDALQPAQTALEHSLPAVVALDVEYVHFRESQHALVPGEPEEQCAAAWVAMVDGEGKVLLDSRCQPRVPLEQLQRCWVGGVPPDQLHGAPPVEEVAARVQKLSQGKRLVGHGLTKVGGGACPPQKAVTAPIQPQMIDLEIINAGPASTGPSWGPYRHVRYYLLPTVSQQEWLSL